MPIYNIRENGSSSGGGGSSIDPVRQPLTINSNGQTSFTLPSTPETNSEVMLFLNGLKQTYGTDYSVSGTALTWSSSYNLQTGGSDVLEACYFVSV